MIYQYTCNVPLHQRQHMWFVHDGAPHHFLRNHTAPEPDFRWTVDRTWRPCHLTRTIPLTLILSDFLLWRHLKSLVYWAPINERGIRATSTECLSGDSSERNFQQSAHLYAMQSWRVSWNAWEPHTGSAEETWFLDVWLTCTLLRIAVSTMRIIHVPS
jgi:hypothetical protein